MSGHTKGPWTIGSRSGGHATSVVSATETQWYQSAGGKVPVMVCSMAARDKHGYAEMDANARLIAAAPEMLEALRETAETLADCHGHATQIDHDLGDGDHEAIAFCRCGIAKGYRAARAIIRKATGEGT